MFFILLYIAFFQQSSVCHTHIFSYFYLSIKRKLSRNIFLFQNLSNINLFLEDILKFFEGSLIFFKNTLLFLENILIFLETYQYQQEIY